MFALGKEKTHQSHDGTCILIYDQNRGQQIFILHQLWGLRKINHPAKFTFKWHFADLKDYAVEELNPPVVALRASLGKKTSIEQLQSCFFNSLS